MLFSSIMRTFIICWCDLGINDFAVITFIFKIFFNGLYCMLSKQSGTLYLTDDYVQLLQWVETVDGRARELVNESSTSSSMKSLNDWVDSVSGLASLLCVFTFSKSGVFTEAVFSFDLLLSELVCSSVNESVNRFIIEQENLRESSFFILLDRGSLISESVFSNSSSSHFCHFSSANFLKLTWEQLNRLFSFTLTEWTTWTFSLTGLYMW